jgi:hypothetical protein
MLGSGEGISHISEYFFSPPHALSSSAKQIINDIFRIGVSSFELRIGLSKTLAEQNLIRKNTIWSILYA